MSADCKLCALLGSTGLIDSLDGHSELHSRQLQLISLNHTESTVDKAETVPVNGSHRNGQIPKEKAKKSELFRCSQQLVNIHGRRDCGIKCSQCKRVIRTKRDPSHIASSLINHACVHLNKELYSCRHCDMKFVSKYGLDSHLNQIHGLSRTRANYIDLTDEQRSDIMDMLKVCFGKAPEKQLNVTAFGKQKRNYQGIPLLKLAYCCVEKHQLGDRINCNLCLRSIPNTRQWGAAKELLDHARWHLDKPFFTCRLCQYSASTQGTVASHLINSHCVARSKQNFKDESSEYYEEISSMLEDCFGEMKKEPANSKEQKRARGTHFCTSIRSRCGANSLLAERQFRCHELMRKFQRSGKLRCRICHVHLTVLSAENTYYGFVMPMQHALVHLNKLIFTCRRCSYTSTTMNAMVFHVRRKHGVPPTNEFDDRTEDYHAEFMDMLSKCFNWDLEPERSEAAIVTPKNYLRTSITSSMGGNDLKAARHIRASELIGNHARDGKIICQICSHPVLVSGGIGSQYVFRHAMTHLDNRCWPYRCRLCSYVSIDRSNIFRHLKTRHNDKGEIEDMSDKFHSEIMKSLSKCYECVETGETS